MNKTLLVLGASSDLGLALIEKTHSSYDAIIAHYNRNNQALISLREMLGEKLCVLQADFSSEQEPERLIDRMEKIAAPTHIVHFPAGKVRNINFHKSNWDHVETDIHISLRSVYKIIQRFIKPMVKARYGKIVFVLTSNTVRMPKYMLDYTTVKYALLGFMKSLATEYADKSINVNAVSPSMIETDFLSDIPRIIVEQSAADNPMRRNANVGDIIPMLEFLLSDEAGYITGQNVVLSGGSVI